MSLNSVLDQAFLPFLSGLSILILFQVTHYFSGFCFEIKGNGLSFKEKRRLRNQLDGFCRPAGFTLFHCHALGQISRLIHVQAAGGGNVIGQHL